jgi:hypothetical protein
MKVTVTRGDGTNPGRMCLTPEDDAEKRVIADLRAAFDLTYPNLAASFFPNQDGETKFTLPFQKLGDE